MSYHSQFPNLRRSDNPELLPAVAAVPGDADAKAALDRCSVALWARQTAAMQPANEELVNQLVSALSAGEDVPETFDADIARFKAEAAGAELGRAVLIGAEQSLGNLWDQNTSAHVDDVLAALARRLDQTLSEARALDLGGATSADEAIERGHAEAWRVVTRLRSDYVNLRAAQLQVMRDIGGGIQHVDTFGFLCNYRELYPRWMQHGTDSGESRLTWNGSERIYVAPPWPDDDADRFDWLLATPAAQAWIPTTRQLGDALQAADDARREARQPHAEKDRTAWEAAARKLQRQIDAAAWDAYCAAG